jgi:protoporphyrinogen IX oxidase
MTAWFAGLFYLPRLFVYHTEATDLISLERFKIMEWRLYYAIMWPAAIMTTVFGGWLFYFAHDYYMHARWMQAKLFFVVCVWIYHVFCGIIVQKFKVNQNHNSARYYRMFNEIPTLFLIVIVLLVVMKP